jgi:hypothetical protein
VETSTVPLKWKIARLIPIHKYGSRDQPINFRPISVLPVLSKLLEKAVHWQYRNFLEEENLLSDRQFGFRAGRSTNLAATLFVDDIRNDVDKGSLVATSQARVFYLRSGSGEEPGSLWSREPPDFRGNSNCRLFAT